MSSVPEDQFQTVVVIAQSRNPLIIDENDSNDNVPSSNDVDALEELCLQAGWEFVELGEGLDNDSDTGSNSEGETTNEMQRVCDALMAHPWSHLKLKADSRQDNSAQEANDISGQSLDAIANLNTLVSAKQIVARGIDDCSRPEPTAEDEALAASFLEKINGYELSLLTQSQSSEHSVSDDQRRKRAHEELERFLDRHESSRLGEDPSFGDNFDDLILADSDSSLFSGDAATNGLFAALSGLQGEAARVRRIDDSTTREAEAAKVATAFAELVLPK